MFPQTYLSKLALNFENMFQATKILTVCKNCSRVLRHASAHINRSWNLRTIHLMFVALRL